MKAKFILINSKIAPEGFLYGENLQRELEQVGLHLQSAVAVQTVKAALKPLTEAAEDCDLMVLICGEPMERLSKLLARVLELPLTVRQGSFPIPKGAGRLGSGEASGFVLTEGNQAILCLPGEPQAMADCFISSAMPFILRFFCPLGESRTIPLTSEQIPYAHRFAATLNEQDCCAVVYDSFMRIFCKKASKGESALLAQELGEQFLKSLPQPQEKAVSLRDKLKESKNARKKPWYSHILPAKRDTRADLARKAVLMLCIAVFIGSTGYLANHYLQSYLNEKHYSSLEEIYVGELAEPEGYPQEYQNKFAGLYAVNPEVVGWLNIPDTGISYPVVQHENNEYYLTHDFYGNKIPHGAPFVDSMANLREESTNILIFGHNMKDGQMFAPLTRYQEVAFYKEHPVITFDSVYRDHDYKIISVFITNNNPAHGEIFPYHAFVEAENTLEMSNFLSEVQARSLIVTGVDVLPSDKLLTLSTCTYEFDDARFVVVARQVREGESTAVDTSLARLNPAPLMPDIWYELYGGTKPNGAFVTPTVPQTPAVEETAPSEQEAAPPQEEAVPEQSEQTEESEQVQTPAQEEAPAPEQPPVQEQTPEQESEPPAAEQPTPPEQTQEQPTQQQTQPQQAPTQPEPAAPAASTESSKQEDFECACDGCNYISYHDNCTGDVDNCPCTCGVCQEKSKNADTYTASVKNDDSSDKTEKEDKTQKADDDEDFNTVALDETLKVKIGGSTKTYDTYEIICMVVQNEMGATFHQEALKAQAVAAYSYIKYNNMQGIAPSVMVKTPLTADVKQAVKAVLGEGVYYGGSICNTTYYSCSAGVTNNARDVWGGSVAYLTSVDAPEDEKTNKYYGAKVTVSEKSMASCIESYLGIDPDDYGNPEDWIDDIATFENDMYVKSVSVAGKTISGRQFREGLMKSKIYSHAFEVEYDDGSFIFTTYGYGHGVGLSQLGANVLAKDGWDYKEILEHYYSDTKVK